MFNPIAKKTVSKELLDGIAAELQKYKDTKFYTCHCTGEKAYHYLSQKTSNLKYISCGDVIEM